MRIYVLALCLTAGVLLELATLGLASHGHDYSVCNTTQIKNSSLNMVRPNISGQFHTRVEAVIVNKNKTTIVHEYFDAANNRGFVRVLDSSISFDAWYDYNSNEFIGYYPNKAGGPGYCYVQDLSKTDQRFLFGYQTVNGHPSIYSAAGALHFGGQGIEEMYMGKTTVRNINVDWWRSCQYWKDRDATMTVDWYLTSGTTWDSTVGKGAQMPVQAHVTGMVYKDGTGHHFEHYYNFFDFKPYLDSSNVFETPAGVTCPGRKLTRKFPIVPNDAFSFTTEIVDVQNDLLSFMKETFYYSQKLVKYEYRPQFGDFSPYGTTDLIEIHDFHSGVAYITDAARGNCSYRAIESGDFDVRSSGPNTVRIRNAKEFFYLDTKNVSYEGIKQNRGLDCDTWIATRSDYPFGAPSNSTWEWYFATNKWQQAYAGPEAGAIPIQMRITIPARGWRYQYNIYHFQKSKPDLLKFDISACYQFKLRRKFQFMVPVQAISQAQISSNVEVFKYYVLQAIMMYTKISPLRVAHLQVFFADNIIVTFELLDVSPTNVGDTHRAPDYSEVPLNFAANTVAQMIQNGQFVIPLKGSPFTQLHSLVATPNSIVEITYLNSTTGITTTKTGYGAGPMAAVGVTMPLLGGGLGVLFAYFFFK